jgi:multidrug efflux pump subunit AcrA (membrane-fusion protein)
MITLWAMSIFSRFWTICLRPAISLALLALTGGIIYVMMIPEDIPHVSAAVSTTTVEVVPIQRHETGIDFSVDGEVIPFRRIDLVAEIQGRVIYKSEQCRLGQYVQKDELLLKIDPVDYQLAVDQAITAVSQAKVNIDENAVQQANTEKELTLAKERLELSRRDYERNQQLVERRTVTQADLENIQSGLLTTQEAIQRLENQLRVLVTQTERLNVLLRKETLALENAQLNLARTEVKAPIAGVVTADTFEVNSFIQKGANVAKILDTSQLEIQCSLYMKQIQWIWRQSDKTTGYVLAPTPVTILYDTEGECWAWEGELKTLDGGVMNPVTRMVPCRVKVDNPQSGKRVQGAATGTTGQPMLFAGMYVTVIIHSKPDIPLYRIPERALLPGNKIWTVTDGRLQQHSIRIATTTPEGVLFYADSESIQPHGFVVVSPLASPTEGNLVQIVQQVEAFSKSGEIAIEY